MNITCLNCGMNHRIESSTFNGPYVLDFADPIPPNRQWIAIWRCPDCEKNFLVSIEALDNEIKETIDAASLPSEE